MVRFMKRRCLLTALWAMLGLGLVLAVSAAQAGKITLGTPVVTADGGLDVSVNVTPDSGQDVAALQFDLHYDSSRYGFTDAASGGAAAGAGKDTVVSDIEPGMVRVVVAGINQDTLGSGTVATLHFERTDKTSAPPSFSDNATLNEVVASGPSGEDVEGLDVSGAVSEAAAASANDSNGKISSTGTSASGTAQAQNTSGNVPVAPSVTGLDPVSGSERQNPGMASPRNTTGMDALVGPRGPVQSAANAGTAGVPQTYSGVPTRRVPENPPSGTPVRVANASSPKSVHGHGQYPKAAPASPNAGDTVIAGRSSWVSPADHANGNLDETLVAGTGSVSRPYPAVAASKTFGGAVKMNDSSNSGMIVFLVGGITAFLLMLGAWVARKG